MIPLGIDHNTFGTAIDVVVDDYNKANGTDFGDSSWNDSVVFRPIYDKTSNNFSIEIRSRTDNNRLIGTLNEQNIRILVSKD